jgi:transcriptional regulator with XRE-family HTH domain
VQFYRAVGDELARIRTPLDRISSVLGVSRTELARLFGVRRQAIEQWESRGVPGERQEKLATLNAVVDLLTAKLKPDRIPGVVRRPAAAYGDRSILDAIAAGDEALVIGELRNAFDWAAVA